MSEKTNFVELKFQRSSAVAVGAFNVHIIQPTWLAKAKIFENSHDADVEFEVEKPGFRFHSKKRPELKWVVRPERLVIESSEDGSDPASLVARVLELLPHTPLVGIGINFVFSGTPGITRQLKQLGFPQDFKHQDLRVIQKTWHVGLKDKVNNALNLQLADSEGGTELSVNFHFDGDNRANADALIFLRKYSAHRAEASKLAREVFGVET